MTYKIYHNPQCTKSRKTLEMLQERNIKPEVCEYKIKGITASELDLILELLHKKPIEICRTGESLFIEKNLKRDDPDEKIFEALLENPILLERPIVIKDQKQAIIGRPAENVLELF